MLLCDTRRQLGIIEDSGETFHAIRNMIESARQRDISAAIYPADLMGTSNDASTETASTPATTASIASVGTLK